MKKSEVMTDVILMLPDQSSIPCHKVVLMAASPYFKTMFQSGLRGGTEQDVEVDFPDAEATRSLVDFFYTGVIDVTARNAKQLIAASEFFCCEDLKAYLKNFLDDNVDYVGFSNCIGFYKLSRLYNLAMLLVTAFEFILIHFKGFASMSDFETLTEDELLEIVSNDGLNMENEDIVFDAVVHWVDADPELRKKAFSRIAPLIRFPFCTLAMLTGDVCHNRLMLSSGCFELAHEALSSPYHYNSHHAIHNARCVPRYAFKGNKKEHLVRMIELGSSDRICCSVTIATGQRALEWNDMLDVQSKVMEVVCCSTGIYWVDYKGGSHFLNMKTKKVISNRWEPANVRSTMVIIDETITAFGGCTADVEQMPLKSVAFFNTEEANPGWKPLPEMLHALRKPNVVRFANKVYVFGGEDDNGSCRVTQEFDIVRGKWRMRSEMPGLCSFASAVALNDKIFVIGGEKQVCYSYEPSKDVWKVLAQPTEIYYSLTTATTWKGKILLGNGDQVEEYDPTEDTWSFQNHVLPEDPDIYRMVLHTVCL